MKKNLQLLCLLILGSLASNSLSAQCSFTLSATDTTICTGDSVTLTATPFANEVTTTFAAGNNHRGNMFDIVAINEVTITSFDAHPMGNTDFEVYYKVGAFAGSENVPGDWTLVGSATGVVAQPLGTATPVPIPINITIPIGQTYAFYVSSTNTAVSLNYTDGSAPGSVYTSDANIQFLEGVGIEYPFSGTPFSPRIWNGNIHYYVGGTPTAPTFLWNTGAVTSSITVGPTDTTQYNVSVDINGCSTLDDSLTINSVGTQVNLGPDMDFCAGDSVVLDAGSAGSTFLWSNASTNQINTIYNGGMMYVDVVDTFGCASVDSITVTELSNPVVNLGADSTICENEAMILNGGAGLSTYTWSTGDTTQTTDVGNMMLSPGLTDVILSVVDGAGCIGSDTVSIMVNAAPVVNLGLDTTICVNGSVTLDAGAGFSTYTWYDASTNQTLLLDGSVLGIGTETVLVTVSNADGCEGSDMMIVTVDACAGIDDKNSVNFNAYPNPASDLVNINFTQSTNAIVRLSTVEGRLIESISIKGAANTSLDVSTLSPGIYSLTVIEGHNTLTKQLIIQ